MEANTTNMPCNAASLNWSEDDIKKIEKRQEFYNFLFDNYDTSLITKAIMELNEEGKLTLKDEIEDHKDEIIEKLEKIKVNNMNNVKEENIERMEYQSAEEDLKKCIEALERILEDFNNKGLYILDIKTNPIELYEGDFVLTVTEIRYDGILTVKKSDDPNVTIFDIHDLTINDNVHKLYDVIDDALKNYVEEENENEYAPVSNGDACSVSELSDCKVYSNNSSEDELNDTCDCGGTFERCDDTAPCCDDEQIPDVYDYLTDDMFPEEATEKDKYNKYVRKTPWTEIESYNKSNKKIVDEYIKYFRENFPDRAKGKTDIEILSENDDIWEKGLYDNILLNSLKNGDYVLDTYSDDGYVKGGLKGKDRHDVLANFDVVIDCTLVGYVCRPYIVFGISKQHSWMANTVDDDYTREELKKISDLSGPKNDEDLHWWRTEGVYKYREREIELYKEGHIRFEIKDIGTEYRQYIRKVDHKAEKHKVTRDIW